MLSQAALPSPCVYLAQVGHLTNVIDNCLSHSLSLSVCPSSARRAPRCCLARERAPIPRTASSSTQVKTGCTLASAWPRRLKSHRLRWDRIPGAPSPWPEPALGSGRAHDLRWFCPAVQTGASMLTEHSSDAWFPCLYFERDAFPKRLARPYHPAAVSEEPERRWSFWEGPVQPTHVACSLATATSSQPASGSARGCGVRCAAARNRDLPAKEYWEIFKKGFMCIAPNHVLLLIDFGYSRISSYLFHTQISHAFTEKTIWGHLVHTSGGWVGSWGLLSKILLGLQDCVIAVMYTVTDVSQSSYCVTDLKSVGICKQGSKQDIFLPCIQ